ncbi:MAG TPA: hypothetical protein VGB18_01125 [Candidatus Thermoplasmatota archaeon]
MNKTLARMTAVGATLALVLTTLIVFIPPAAAQSQIKMVVAVEDDSSLVNNRLLPETGRYVGKVKVTITADTGNGCISTVQLTYKPTNPGYSTVIFNPPSQTVTLTTTAPGAPAVSSAPTTTQAQDVDMIVVTNRNAPAFEDGKYEVKVDATGGSPQTGCTLTTGTATGSTVIKNDYLPLTLLNPSQLYIKSGQNKKVVFPVEVQNLGNGPTRVKVEATQPNKNKLDAVSVGAEIRLESKTRGAAAQFKQTRNVEVQTPHANGYSNSIYQFNVKYTSAFDGTASGALATDEQTISLAVQVQGVYVPGFDPTLLIGALGIGMLLLRRRMGQD